MAQIIHNISQPNDGLGDKLRIAFDNQNQMNSELYSEKVDKITGRGLTEANFTNAEKIKLSAIPSDAEKNVQANLAQNDNTQDDYVIGRELLNLTGDNSKLTKSTLPLSFYMVDANGNQLQKSLTVEQLKINTNTTIDATWNNKIVIFTANVTLTIPTGLPAGFTFDAIILPTYSVTFAVTSGLTMIFGTPTPATKSYVFVVDAVTPTNIYIIK